LAEGNVIVFEAAREINTHGHLKKISVEGNKNFLQNKYNMLLK
jgi:hypothetical protein